VIGSSALDAVSQGVRVVLVRFRSRPRDGIKQTLPCGLERFLMGLDLTALILPKDTDLDEVAMRIDTDTVPLEQ
jgi:hypothetical protein